MECPRTIHCKINRPKRFRRPNLVRIRARRLHRAPPECRSQYRTVCKPVRDLARPRSARSWQEASGLADSDIITTVASKGQGGFQYMLGWQQCGWSHGLHYEWLLATGWHTTSLLKDDAISPNLPVTTQPKT